MGLIAVLVVLTSAGFLYFMGESGFDWGKPVNEKDSINDDHP
ncbi:hypothetical protein [Virgibacillus ihumii]|nr:hypothetical protein [Virgibacillus ihumii]